MQQSLTFNKAFLSDLWSLVKPYWTSEEKWSAWALLFLNILCMICGVRANVGFNQFHKIFFNALQDFNQAAIFSSLEYLLVVIVCLTISMSGAVYFNGLLSIRWRRWLTKNYLQKWLHNHNHYRLQFANQGIDNPDQRISEDLDKFPTTTLTLFFGPYKFLYSFMMIISFSYILWDLSRYFIFKIQSASFSIPGYLFWVALFYVGIGTWIMNWLGKKLATLNYQQQHFNADFRFSLVRLRESSEQVSLLRGESAEHENFHGLFAKIYANFVKIVSLQTRLTIFDKGYGFFAYALGLIVATPFYLAKAFQLGIVMQISSAFSSVVMGFSIFMDSFNELADWRSVIHRLAEFTRAIEYLNKMPASQIALIVHDGDNIIVEDLTLKLSDETVLLKPVNFILQHDQSVLLKGGSGLGKSTMLRALAGIWAHGEGKIFLPKNKNMLFLPQKPYLPLGSLRELLIYPLQNNIHDAQLIETLHLCGLEKFQLQLGEIKNWSHELSPGEQQRVALARLFLQKPDVIFLDEATSALDEKMEARIYMNIKRYHPEVLMVSVSHRDRLHKFHDVIIDMDK